MRRGSRGCRQSIAARRCVEDHRQPIMEPPDQFIRRRGDSVKVPSVVRPRFYFIGAAEEPSTLPRAWSKTDGQICNPQPS
jgi:hypothetical protein